MTLPDKDYFGLDEVAARWSRLAGKLITISELLHHGAVGRLRIAVHYRLNDGCRSLGFIGSDDLLRMEGKYREKLHENYDEHNNKYDEHKAFRLATIGVYTIYEDERHCEKISLREPYESPQFIATTALIVTRQERDRFEQEYLTPAETLKADSPEPSTRERHNLLRIIGGLALLIIEQQRGTRFGTPTEVNRARLAEELQRVLADVDARTEGTSKSTIYKIMPEDILEALGLPKNSH